MSTYGLRVRDSSGNVVFDVSNYLGRVLGSVDTGTTSGSVTADFSTGTPFWIIYSLNSAGNVTQPTVSVSGDTLSWSFGGSYPTACLIIYGIY